VLANYVAHAWMAAIALAWFFLLGRRFPIGGLNQRRLRPWYVVGLILIAANAAGTFASPPAARLHLPNLPTLIAELVFLAFIVGPTEELLFRGLIQTALNGSIHARLGPNPSPRPSPRGKSRDPNNPRGEGVGGWRLELGTVIGAILFGLIHFINLGYQSLATMLQQVITAIVIGLVFGVLYDRTRNLVGASLAHSVADFSGTAIPLLAYLMTSR